MRESMTGQELIYKVKPCPFCGNKDVEITSKEFWEKVGTGLVSIDCDCGCTFYHHADPKFSWENAVEEAIAKWNDRGWEEE